MLIEYRDQIAPKVIGRQPERIFVNADGTPKSQAMVALLIKNTLRKRAGIILTPHQFRHLGAKTILDDQPGAHRNGASTTRTQEPQDDKLVLQRNANASRRSASPTAHRC